MQQYVTQLIEDLRAAADNLPTPYPYDIDHPMPEGKEWLPELALSPFKEVSEWTGIATENFPPVERLTPEQAGQLVAAMEALWKAYAFEFDIAGEMAEKEAAFRYRMMVHCWDDLVQYLPQSGFDIELCAGNPVDCRMGPDCLCLHDPPEIEDDLDDTREIGPDENEELPF